MPTRSKLGDEIKALRQAAGLSQEELGKRCDIRKAQMSKIEKDVGVASARRLLSIADALGVELAFAQAPVQQLGQRIAEAGFTHCFKSQEEARPTLQGDVLLAKQLRLLTIRGWELFGKTRSILGNALRGKDADCKVQILLLNPESEYVPLLDKLIDSIPGTLGRGIQETIRALVDIRRRSEANIELRLFDDFPGWRLLFLDSTLFLAGSSKSSRLGSSESLHYRIQRTEPDSLFLPFELYFQYVWDQKSASI